MIDLIFHVLLLAAVILAVAKSMPGIRVEGYSTAIIVAIVYGLVNVTLGTVLKIFSFPLMFLTLGLFAIIINTFLLWITDQLLEDFEIEGLGNIFIVAVIITLADTVLGWIF